MSKRVNRIKGDQVLCNFCGKWDHKSKFRLNKRRVNNQCPYHGRCFECRQEYRINKATERKEWNDNFHKKNPTYRRDYSRAYKHNDAFKERRYASLLKENILKFGQSNDSGYIYVLARPGSDLIIYGITNNYKRRIRSYISYGDYTPIFVGYTIDNRTLEKALTYSLKLHHRQNRGVNYEKLYATRGDRYVILDSLTSMCSKVLLSERPTITHEEFIAACPCFGVSAHSAWGQGLISA